MLRLLIIFGFLWSTPGFADLSLFQKIALLRFGPEQLALFENGSMNLNALGSEEHFHAQGEVYFIPGQFLEPEYLDETAFQELILEKKAIRTPLRLKTYPFPLAGSEATFGTFVLRFHNDRPRRLAFAFPRLFHPTEIHYVDPLLKRRLLVHGKLSQDPTQNTNFSDLTITIPVVETERDFYLYAQVSGPIVGGHSTVNLSSFYVGEDHAVNKLVYDGRFYAVLVSGCFLITFIFYFFIFSFRPSDYSSLYLCLYALTCFALSVIYSMTLPLSNFQVLDLFTCINVFGIASLQCYLFDKLSFLMARRTYRWLVSITFFIGFLTTFSVLQEIALLTALCFITLFLSSTVLIFATLYLGLRHRLSGISFFLVGAALNTTFQVPIMVRFILESNAEVGYYILLANLGMALSLALVNAKEFAVTYRNSLEQREALAYFNKNLEKLVDNKTKEVRALLDYIPQGVLSLAEGGVINKDFSAHLAQILGAEAISQQNFKKRILDRCEMSADMRDQAWQSILSICGELEFNYDVNADKLPAELLYRDGDEKFLRATWNVEIEEGKVLRLLVTLLDCTAERELQKEAEQQRQELVHIQELINISANKAAQFFSTSAPLLRENERIIQSGELTHNAIRLLFVNAHTVKGAARTLQLRDLARQVHDMEDYYAHILKDQLAWDTDKLKADIRTSSELLETYAHINKHKLNRGDTYSKVVIERDFIEKHYFFIRDMVDDPPHVSNIIEWLREQNEELTKLIFEQLPASFDGYKERAIKIAKDLGKAEPTFDFSIDDVSILPDQKAVLDNCMVHLLRNALDHGIESPSERRQKGKTEHGCIKVNTTYANNLLTISLSDDGRGLALRKLKAKGEALGLLNPGSTPQEIAGLIFHSGVSTAHEVSEISGRGVGMNAVKSFVEKVGGTIQIRLGAPKDEAQDFYEFWFEIQFRLGQIPTARAALNGAA